MTEKEDTEGEGEVESRNGLRGWGVHGQRHPRRTLASLWAYSEKHGGLSAGQVATRAGEGERPGHGSPMGGRFQCGGPQAGGGNAGKAWAEPGHVLGVGEKSTGGEAEEQVQNR